ncbi:hypothetical protein R7P75_23810 [Vibrio sp. 2175-1]|uniref:hypothetical protein n=1 Tax=Vibrio TaxID=662 RepID=UPI001CDC3254|nr:MULTISPECIES: hypothetical protein [Vibrio]MCA2494073.1 hypothetical protein [Vibrio alginolyticus]MDW2221229.1 hypothetical protein [Vibrio sp. 2175-1]
MHLPIKSKKVFLTKGNLGSIVSTFSDPHLKLDIDDLYKSNLRDILSIPELNLLYFTREAFKDFDSFISRYEKIKKRDTKTYVFEGGAPAFHYSPNCDRLSADFENFLIPVEIKYKGDKEIEKFRKFYKENKYLLSHNESLFITRLEAQFLLKNPPKKIDHHNSGIAEIHNYNLADLEKEIDNLLLNANIFRNSSEEIKKKIKNLGYGTHKVKEAKDRSSPLYTWHHNFKGKLKILLTEYFRVKFNPELSFNGDLLIELGFVPCSQCSSHFTAFDNAGEQEDFDDIPF